MNVKKMLFILCCFLSVIASLFLALVAAPWGEIAFTIPAEATGTLFGTVVFFLSIASLALSSTVIIDLAFYARCREFFFEITKAQWSNWRCYVPIVAMGAVGWQAGNLGWAIATAAGTAVFVLLCMYAYYRTMLLNEVGPKVFYGL